jgi:hypothetical protein
MCQQTLPFGPKMRVIAGCHPFPELGITGDITFQKYMYTF